MSRTKQKEDLCLYRMKVKTSDKGYADMDGEAVIELFGSSGNSGPMPLEVNTTKTRTFRKGQTDEFEVLGKDVGKLEKMKVAVADPVTQWHLEDITVITEDANMEPEVVSFPCNDWLGGSSAPAERMLSAQTAELVPYKMEVETSDIKHAGTGAPVHVVLQGANGKSTRKLELKEDGKKRRASLFGSKSGFDAGSTKNFELTAEDVGALETIRIGTDGSDGWHPGKVVIESLFDRL